MSEPFEPKILGLLCSWCSYAGADTAGVSRAQYPPNIRIVRVMCSGRVDPLFVARAFEQGADGVLVAGCHPGDCHYVSGNNHAERRLQTLAGLLDLFGLDRRRLKVAWVSASEGARFAAVVSEFTEELRGMGRLGIGDWGLGIGDRGTGGQGDKGTRGQGEPASPLACEAGEGGRGGEGLARLSPLACEAGEGGRGGEGLLREAELRLRDRARELLESGAVEVVVGYRQGSSVGRAAPFVARTPAEAERLVWSEACVPNLAGTLRKHANRRAGVALKACDARSVAELLKLHQLDRTNLHVVGMPCEGMGLAKCATCADAPAELYDEYVGGKGERGRRKAEGGRRKAEGAPSLEPSTGGEVAETNELRGPVSAESAQSAQSAERLPLLDADARRAFWAEQLSRCTLCYACQAACPLCYCKECALALPRDDQRRLAREPRTVFAYHLVRAHHLAERCTGCDECERVCPEGIPLGLVADWLEGQP